VEVTIRVAPVEVLIQAEIVFDRGAASAAVPARRAQASAPTDLRVDIETSGKAGCIMKRGRNQEKYPKLYFGDVTYVTSRE
jgi:hypothetical protein